MRNFGGRVRLSEQERRDLALKVAGGVLVVLVLGALSWFGRSLASTAGLTGGDRTDTPTTTVHPGDGSTVPSRPGVKPTTTTTPEPAMLALEDALLIPNDVEAVASGRLNMRNDRGHILDGNEPASGTVLCESVAVVSRDQFQDVARAFEYGPLNYEGLGNEITQFRTDVAAQTFIDELAQVAGRCGLLRGPSAPPAGADQALRVTQPGDAKPGIVLNQGTARVDWVFVRKGSVVVQIEMQTLDANQSTKADALAALSLSRLVT